MAGAKPPDILFFCVWRFLRDLLPPVFATFGDIIVVAVIGGRTHPGAGSAVIGRSPPLAEGWRAKGLKNSAGDKYPAPLLRWLLLEFFDLGISFY